MELFLSALVTLTVIIDPLGTAAVYGALTGGMTNNQAEAVARKACIVGFGVLLFFGLMGSSVLAMLGITLEAFRIAGGLLLFVIAFRMLMGDHDQQSIQKDNSVYSDRGDIAVFPLAIPLLSGPGCITAIILLTNTSHAWLDQLQVYTAMVIAVVVSYLSMKAVHRLKTMMGILLAALAIQFIVDGVRGIIKL
jgi:multiple antibiotic resistance protein